MLLLVELAGPDQVSHVRVPPNRFAVETLQPRFVEICERAIQRVDDALGGRIPSKMQVVA